MINTKLKSLARRPATVSNFFDFGVTPCAMSYHQRQDNVERVIERFFAGNIDRSLLQREALARYVCPGENFSREWRENQDMAQDGFGYDLLPPSSLVEQAFRDYGQTDLGAVAIARLLRWDDQYIDLGWRFRNGALSEKGIHAYGAGYWRPFRVASNGDEHDSVTPSGAMLLPDVFNCDYYSTGDIAHPFAIIHHELKAHVLPLMEGRGLQPGHKMQLICIGLESELLREIDLPERQLHWGKDGGTLDHTLNVGNQRYYHGLVQRSDDGDFIEIDALTGQSKGPAVEKYSGCSML